jgi:hypothetical protein
MRQTKLNHGDVRFRRVWLSVILERLKTRTFVARERNLLPRPRTLCLRPQKSAHELDRMTDLVRRETEQHRQCAPSVTRRVSQAEMQSPVHPVIGQRSRIDPSAKASTEPNPTLPPTNQISICSSIHSISIPPAHISRRSRQRAIPPWVPHR